MNARKVTMIKMRYSVTTNGRKERTMVNVLTGMGFALVVLVWIAISIALVYLCGYMFYLIRELWDEIQCQ